jgi:hypothetical protein
MCHEEEMCDALRTFNMEAPVGPEQVGWVRIDVG